MEAFATVFAGEWFDAGMNSGVCIQCGASVKCFATGCAHVRFFLGVYDFVPTKGTRLAEAFTTDFTDERTRACVYRHVPGQVVVSVEGFTAVLACVDFWFKERIAATITALVVDRLL